VVGWTKHILRQGLHLLRPNSFCVLHRKSTWVWKHFLVSLVFLVLFLFPFPLFYFFVVLFLFAFFPFGLLSSPGRLDSTGILYTGNLK
jgi:hypothetical protein